MATGAFGGARGTAGAGGYGGGGASMGGHSASAKGSNVGGGQSSVGKTQGKTLGRPGPGPTMSKTAGPIGGKAISTGSGIGSANAAYGTFSDNFGELNAVDAGLSQDDSMLSRALSMIGLNRYNNNYTGEKYGMGIDVGQVVGNVASGLTGIQGLGLLGDKLNLEARFGGPFDWRGGGGQMSAADRSGAGGTGGGRDAARLSRDGGRLRRGVPVSPGGSGAPLPAGGGGLPALPGGGALPPGAQQATGGPMQLPHWPYNVATYNQIRQGSGLPPVGEQEFAARFAGGLYDPGMGRVAPAGNPQFSSGYPTPTGMAPIPQLPPYNPVKGSGYKPPVPPANMYDWLNYGSLNAA